MVNWRTRPEDVDMIVPTVLEIGAALRAEAGPPTPGTPDAQENG